jgi:SAM-dependent methyltransferase
VKDSTKRFSDRVENYIRCRPGYPRGIVPFLEENCGLRRSLVVADIGSGTGLLARVFLDHGNLVYGVEPNGEMRRAGERLLGAYRGFRSLEGRAEATGLPAGSIDFVTAGQAFHWFDPTKARAEFARILTPGGWVVLVWNERRIQDDPFGEAYEAILRKHAVDYEESSHRHLDEEAIHSFFRPYETASVSFANAQAFGFEDLKGRLLSASYTPLPGDPRHGPMMEDLRRVFERHAVDGRIRMHYDTRAYYGQLPPAGGRKSEEP